MARRDGRRKRSRGPDSSTIGSGTSCVRAADGVVRTVASVALLPLLLAYRLVTSNYIVYAFVGALALVGVLMGLSMAGVVDAPDSAPAEDDDSLNQTLAERLIHDEINEIRSNRDLLPLEFNDGFASDARSHSRDMARNDYFSHTTPGGVGIRSRYGTGCVAVGENIAQTHWQRNIEGEGVITSEPELAESVADQWMNSEGHRENILREGWRSEGIGIAMDGDKVYVTQGFCGG